VIPYGKQNIEEKDIEAVVDVLKSDFLTQGPQVPLFEEEISRYTGSQYTIAVNSATSALHLACLALGLTKGDILWTSPNSFVASANCALYCGAKVDFVDINPKTYNLSIESLEKKLIESEINNTLPKVVVPVHFAGQSCDMEKIFLLSKKYNFRIIEDASHAIGGEYKKTKVGNCKFSDMTVFSFHPVKIITTGEGGAITTNSINLAEKLKILRSHGITKEKKIMSHYDGDWFYEQIELGFNYRMTDIQAALGRSQLTRIDKFVEERHKIYLKYKKNLKNFPVILPFHENFVYSSLHLYPILISDESNKKRDEVFNYLREKGVFVNVHYIPIHSQPFYQNLGFARNSFPNAMEYYKKTISLPIFPGLTNQNILFVTDMLSKALK